MASNRGQCSSYSLSTEIHSHTGDVRAVGAFKDGSADYILTTSRDKTACIWKRTIGSPDVSLVKSMTQHTGFVSAVCVIPPDPSVHRNEGEVIKTACNFFRDVLFLM